MDWRLARILRGLVTIFLAFNLGFVLIHMMPGGPAQYIRQQLLSEGMNEDVVQNIVQAYMNVRPDATLLEQYITYWSELLFKFDMGKSIWYGDPVFEVLAPYVPWTVFLFSLVTWMTFPIGILLGALMAYTEGSRFDKSMTAYIMITGSIPGYIVAIVLLFWLGMQWELFPWRGRVNWNLTPGFNPQFIGSVLYHAALPVISMALPFLGGLGVRAYAIRILGSDYIRVARLRGVPTSHIVTKYVARNSLLPSYTGLLMGLPGIFGGSVIIETIFQYKGVGWIMFRAAEIRDFPLLMAAFIFTTVLTIAAIVTAELTYGYIDPRAKEGGENVESY